MKMCFHQIVYLFGLVVLSTGNLDVPESYTISSSLYKDVIKMSASFSTITKLVPAKDSYNATLTFNVLNTCDSDVKSVKVFRGDIHQFSQPTCYVRYKDGSCNVAMGCTCNKYSQNVSLNRNVDEHLKDEVWILEGELTDGALFNETVVFNTESMPLEHFPLVIVVASSTCGAGVIVVIIFVSVCCKRRNAQVSLTSRQSVRGCPGRPLPQQPPSPRAHDAGNQRNLPKPSRRHVRPDSSHSYVDMDDDSIKATPGVTRAALKPKPGIKVNNFLHSVSSATDKTHPPLCDDDGYLLADHPPSRETERRAAKPSHADSTV